MTYHERACQEVRVHLDVLLERVAKKQINLSCVYGNCKSYAQHCASLCGDPDHWRDLMPDWFRANGYLLI